MDLTKVIDNLEACSRGLDDDDILAAMTLNLSMSEIKTIKITLQFIILALRSALPVHEE